MGLTSVTDRLGGRQAKRVIELVDDLWANRKKIVEMVDFVWDHRVAITGAIDFVQENQERVGDLVDRLPDLVGSAGSGLEAAGSAAHRASLLLSSDDDDGPRQLSATAADALEQCQEQLSDISGLLAELGDGLHKVRIPTVHAERAEVMGFSLISGVDIGERPLLDVASKRVDAGADGLADVAAQLGDVATRFRSLGSHLAEVGADLGETADELTDSGETLRSFVTDMPDAAVREGGSTQRSSAAPRKKRSTKNTATKKKAASKKAASKKAPSKTQPKKKAASKKRPTKQRSTIVPEN